MDTPCIEWPGTLTPEGYGHAHNGAAHRVAWVRARGPVPDGLELDHLCRNRRCMNLDHLEAVTHQENVNRGARATATHCKWGHPFDAQNTRSRAGQTSGRYRFVNGRACRACVAAAQRRYQARKRAAA